MIKIGTDSSKKFHVDVMLEFKCRIKTFTARLLHLLGLNVEKSFFEWGWKCMYFGFASDRLGFAILLPKVYTKKGVVC